MFYKEPVICIFFHLFFSRLNTYYHKVLDGMEDLMIGDFDKDSDKERYAQFQSEMKVLQALARSVVEKHIKER